MSDRSKWKVQGMLQGDMSWSWKLGAIHLRNRRGVCFFFFFCHLFLSWCHWKSKKLELFWGQDPQAQKLPKVLGPMGNPWFPPKKGCMNLLWPKGEQQAGDFLIPNSRCRFPCLLHRLMGVELDRVYCRFFAEDLCCRLRRTCFSVPGQSKSRSRSSSSSSSSCCCCCCSSCSCASSCSFCPPSFFESFHQTWPVRPGLQACDSKKPLWCFTVAKPCKHITHPAKPILELFQDSELLTNCNLNFTSRIQLYSYYISVWCQQPKNPLGQDHRETSDLAQHSSAAPFFLVSIDLKAFKFI